MFSQTFAVAAGMVNSPEVVRAREMVWRQRDQPAVNRFHGNVEDSKGDVIASRREYAALVCRTFDDVAISRKRVAIAFGQLNSLCAS